MKRLLLVLCALACTSPKSAYFDAAGRADLLSGGVRKIEISTPKGKFRVWTKRVGNNPRIKLLTLHGGPGATHEYFEAFDSYLPAAGVEYYYYDQLGSAYSDQPDDPSLLVIARFVEEVEQVRRALGLTRDDFYLLGHSWGGILALEYALAHQQDLKGLLISNMMASIPAYNEYAKNIPMQGPSEMGASGILEKWDRTADLKRIAVPTLTVGARYDTMDPKHMEWMAGQVQRGRHLYCPQGSHLAIYDDQKTYMEGLLRFLADVDAGKL